MNEVEGGKKGRRNKNGSGPIRNEVADGDGWSHVAGKFRTHEIEHIVWLRSGMVTTHERVKWYGWEGTVIGIEYLGTK